VDVGASVRCGVDVEMGDVRRMWSGCEVDVGQGGGLKSVGVEVEMNMGARRWAGERGLDF